MLHDFELPQETITSFRQILAVETCWAPSHCIKVVFQKFIMYPFFFWEPEGTCEEDEPKIHGSDFCFKKMKSSEELKKKTHLYAAGGRQASGIQRFLGRPRFYTNPPFFMHGFYVAIV